MTTLRYESLPLRLISTTLFAAGRGHCRRFSSQFAPGQCKYRVDDLQSKIRMQLWHPLPCMYRGQTGPPFSCRVHPSIPSTPLLHATATRVLALVWSSQVTLWLANPEKEKEKTSSDNSQLQANTLEILRKSSRSSEEQGRPEFMPFLTPNTRSRWRGSMP